MKKKVYVNGYFSNNLGDDLFLYILVNRYPTVNFYVFLNKSKYQHFKGFKNLHIINSNNRLYNKIYNYYKNSGKRNILSRVCDYSVMIGGSIFMEDYCGIRELEKIYRNHQYYILGSNIGPYKQKEYLECVKDIIRRSPGVCVRDAYSYDLIKELPNTMCASDIVFGLKLENCTDVSKKLFVSVMDLESKKFTHEQQMFYEEVLINKIREYQEKGYEVVVASFCTREKDHLMVKKLKNRFSFIEELYYERNLFDVIAAIKSSEVIIATRYHSLVLGLLFEKITIPLIYNLKMKNLLEDVGFCNEMYDILDCKKMNCNKEQYLNVDISKQIISSERNFEKLDAILR